jgi:hypothetical protein
MVMSSSTEDLELLTAVLSAIEPMSNSEEGRKIVATYKDFHEYARVAVAQQSRLQENLPDPAFNIFLDHDLISPDWGSVFSELEMGIGNAGDMTSLAEGNEL